MTDKKASRRQFLAGAGITGVGLVAASTGAPPFTGLVGQADATPNRLARTPGQPADSELFGPLFPSLPPFRDRDRHGPRCIARGGLAPGGIMDARDDLAAGPKNLIVDPTVNGNPTAINPYGTNPDNPTMTAGSTFVGQFTDHDITFDQTSQLGVPQNPLVSPNTALRR